MCSVQLSINFANEKLQQFFLTCVFKEEEALHVKEGVPWKDIEFQDNAGCIAMLEKPPSATPQTCAADPVCAHFVESVCARTIRADGIFRLLDSQCKTPNATESTFCKELNRVHTKADFLVPTRKHRMRCACF